MVVLLNWIPLLLIMGAMYTIYFVLDKRLSFKRGAWIIIGLFICNIVLHTLTASYMPKGVAPKMTNPAFERSNAQIQDRNRKPTMTEAERQEKFDEKFNAVKEADGKL